MVIVCPGPDYAWLPAELAPAAAGLTLLQAADAARRARPVAARYGPALLTGLSLLRYPAFSEQPAAAAAARAASPRERPELLAAGIHLIVTQLPDGDLIVGDTHEYGDTRLAVRRRAARRAGARARPRRLLGVAALEVRERWLGVYPTAPGEPFLVSRSRSPGVGVVEVVSGLGMTTGARARGHASTRSNVAGRRVR